MVTKRSCVEFYEYYNTKRDHSSVSNILSLKILPSLGRLVSSDARAYAYLQESVAAFPEGIAFLEELKKAGFKSPTCLRLTFGITSIYTATA